MANPLQQAVVRRKVIYIGIIIGLFTVSLFWRGKFSLPFSNPARAADQAQTGLNRIADRIARQTIGSQAQRLELRELDQGDPEVAASAARLSLVGSRGFVVTFLWKAAIDKQARNEWHEFEFLVRLVTRLQPNFITPWIFQSWNIAYNVSVENDKLGDMYYYIARGIDLLAQGDRLNTKVYTAPSGETRAIGSPDMRYQIGFYYQNKFGVSDKVQTLRSLAQLSVIKPGERNADILRRPEPRPDPAAPDKLIVTPWAKHQPWVDFCKANPQLLWRLRNKLNLSNPEQIVNFLKDNEKVPTRYLLSGELAPANEQFPAFPPTFNRDDYDATSKRIPDDTYDPFLAARGWFNYAMEVVPPPKTGPKGTGFEGRPIPWSTPEPKVDFNQFLYRLPRSPAYVIFSQYPARSQTYLAERLGKEGWFDETSSWAPDTWANPDDYWLKVDDNDPDVALVTPASSRNAYQLAYTLWQEHGEKLALDLSETELLNLSQLGQRVPGQPGSLPGDFTAEQMETYGITEANIIARKALVYYGQNRSMTNFPYFLASTQAEQADVTIAARKLLWNAELSAQYGRNTLAIRDYVAGLAKWREALLAYPQFHRPEKSDTTEEQTYEFEVELIDLLRDDGAIRRKAEELGTAARAIAPGFPEATKDDLLQAVAEDEAGARVALVAAARNARFQEQLLQLARERSTVQAQAAQNAALALAGFAAETPSQAAVVATAVARRVAEEQDLARELLNHEFSWMKAYKNELRDDPWVRPESKSVVLSRLGRVRTTAAAEPEQPPPDSTAPPAN